MRCKVNDLIKYKDEIKDFHIQSILDEYKHQILQWSDKFYNYDQMTHCKKKIEILDDEIKARINGNKYLNEYRKLSDRLKYIKSTFKELLGEINK